MDRNEEAPDPALIFPGPVALVAGPGKEIRPYQDTGKYEVIFAGPAEEISRIPIGEPKNSPQGPVYAKREVLLSAKKLEDALA